MLRTVRQVPVLALALAALALPLTPGVARAQTTNAQRFATAQTLYDQAVAEMANKDFASACRKLEEVTRLIPEGLGAKLTLGECFESAGKLASAWIQYALVETAAGKAANMERQQKAQARAAALKPKLAQITIDVPGEVSKVAGVEVHRDGVSVGAAQWGVALPVDAGSHTIVVTAPGKLRWSKTVDGVADGATISVRIPALLDDPAAKAGAPALHGTGGAAPVATWQRPAAFVAGGLGLVGVGLGVAFGLTAVAKKDESNTDNHCTEADICDPIGIESRSDARSAGNVSTAMFIAGGVALAGGVVLFVTAPSAKEEAPRTGRGRPLDPPSWNAKVALGFGGLNVQGSW